MESSLRNELAAVEDRHWWFEGRRAILGSVLESFDLRPGTRLLEAGCGNGANLALLSRFGAVHAFEPNHRDRARAQSRGIGRVADGSLPDHLPFPDRRFDVVLALDVIEHLDDDARAVSALGECLDVGGRLVVTVPAGPSLWGIHDQRNGHRRRYTRSGLRALLESSGFRVEKLTGFNTLLYPAVAVVRIAGRLLDREMVSTGMPPPALNALLSGIFASERRIIRHLSLPIGVSLLAVARAARTKTGKPKES